MRFLNRTVFAAPRLVRAAAMAAGWILWQSAAAQGALTIVPAIYATLSDPTIKPYLSSGGGAPFSNSIAIPRPGNLPSDIFVCHQTPPPNVPAKVPCRMLRMQADGSMIDISRQVFGNGPLPSTAGASTKFVVGDFNEDGRPDIFVPAAGQDGTTKGEINILLISNTDGTYTDRSATLPQIAATPHSGCFGDIDGDGHLDIYVDNIGVMSPYFLMGKGDGTFTQQTAGLPSVVLSRQESFTACAMADLDGDGFPELVLGSIGNSSSKGNIVLFNDGKGDFTVRPRLTLPPDPAWPPGAVLQGHYVVLNVLPLDVNHDGWMDLILTGTQNYGGIGIQVLINRGDGTFADESAARMPADANRLTGHWCTFLSVADFNGDGWEDLYCDTGRLEPEYPRLWVSNGNGTWAAVPTNTLPPYSVSAQVKAVDFDGDGIPDLVTFYADTPNVVFQSSFNRTPRTVPSEPLMGTVIAGNAEATILFAAPVTSGPSPVTGYVATCSTGSPASAVAVAAAGSPIKVVGLINGKLYSCSVTARSASGSSLASSAVVVRPTAGLTKVLEFYNPTLDNFFITANPPEQVAVASGAAGADWRLTGMRFNAGGLEQVCRFYGSVQPGPNSHFYTIDPGECQALKNLQASTPSTQKRWNFESNDFASAAPAGGQCANGTVPVYRAYNKGFERGLDSNHRITTNQDAYQAQIAKGWDGEGVVMCAPQ